MSKHHDDIRAWLFSVQQVWEENRSYLQRTVEEKELDYFQQSLSELSLEIEQAEQGNGTIERIEQKADAVYRLWSKIELAQFVTAPISLRPVPIGKHSLPPLPYPYNALEPYISEEIMRLHHNKHHQSYVDGLNKAEEMMEQARKTGEYELIKHWEREAAFHGAGHYLHTLFWTIMSPRGGGKPQGMLGKQLTNDFGSFQRFKDHFSAAAEKVEGVGWAMLVWAPRAHRLEILQSEFHQHLSQQDTIPLLVLDVWEHAYYLKYKNERKPYIQNWWNVVNWHEVEKRFLQARELRWAPF
ncbi:superoxide dismutase [Halalkalibacterium ligniniphilum]|uniref:superoxide dismutase n=1 Tax=Halalkalibacterium ligniniphilum TaxID=1134413 RepID=UPI00034C5A74|nr:superoxide dismutase [Halalkalibacterium ligniniphilum]